jgi:POT family proton-dependent oligopeptide transporter
LRYLIPVATTLAEDWVKDMAAVQHDDNIIAAIGDVKQLENEKRAPDVKSVYESESELDGIHDGLVFPTEEETLTLRRVSDVMPWSAYSGCKSAVFYKP